jgi:hypothetical protein
MAGVSKRADGGAGRNVTLWLSLPAISYSGEEIVDNGALGTLLQLWYS